VSLLELEELENLKGTYDAEQGEHTRQPTEQTADLEVIEDGTKSPIEAESAEIAARRERVEAMKRKIRAKNEGEIKYNWLNNVSLLDLGFFHSV